MITFGSLFTGIGGFDLGFERAGMVCSWQCEIDKHARSVLRKHFNAPIKEDVRNVGRHTVEPVDLICGGFPCQDLSVAGKRKGLVGGRSGLWFEFERVLSELKPGWVVIENVPGLLSSNKGRDFAIILRGLADIGYLTTWRVLDAQFFGVAQRRRRLFIIGSLGNGSSAEILFEREGMRWDPATRRKTRQELTPSAVPRAIDPIEIANTLRVDRNGARGDGTDNLLVIARGQANAEITHDISPTLSVNHEAPIAFLAGQSASARSLGEGDVSPTIGAGGGGNSIPSVLTSWDVQSTHPTLDSGGSRSSPKVMIGLDVRRLMPIECERLQGFPDGWTDGQADSHRYKQLGNAVCVNVAEWIGRRITALPYPTQQTGFACGRAERGDFLDV